jgi:hypothetical protein
VARLPQRAVNSSDSRLAQPYGHGTVHSRLKTRCGLRQRAASLPGSCAMNSERDERGAAMLAAVDGLAGLAVV